jgi:hypothetical protein
MKPLNCCKGCKGLNENGEFRNKLRCTFCKKYALERAKEIYDKQKVNRGCSTCKYCEHVRNCLDYVTAEESVCTAGLECDTINFTVKNCPKWAGKFESEVQP